MNRYTDRYMNRRDLLKAIGCTASSLVLGSPAVARHLIVAHTGSPQKISRIEWMLYDAGGRGPDGPARQRCAVRISTTSGAQGWADVSLSAVPSDEATNLVNDTLLEQDPADHDSIWRLLYQQGLSLETLAAVDVALWDLRARMEGKPVCTLLGAKRQRVKTCLNTGFNQGEPTDYAQTAGACQDSGVGAIRVQPYVEWGAGRNGRTDAGFPDKDMAVYLAVQEAVGPDYPFIADNHGTYTYDEALRVGRLLDDLGCAWYESPMPETEVWADRYMALARELRTPVCGPGAYPDAYEPRIAWLERQACDLSRISIRHGGFTACLQLASACAKAGVALTLAEAGPDSYPYLQLMAATPEAVTPHFEIASLVRELNVLPGRAAPEPVFGDDGRLAVPETPGMGLELDWQYIATHRLR